MSTISVRWLIGVLAVLALSVSVAWFLPSMDAPVPLPLEVTVTGDRRLSLSTGLAEFGSVAQLTESYPAAKFVFSRDLDFTREKLVHATWYGDGFVPPGGRGLSSVVYSQLRPQRRLAGRRVFLTLDEPRSEGRVFSQVFHEDWYSLPKSSEVAMVDSQWAAGLDVVHWLGAALAVLFPLAAVLEWRSKSKAARSPLRPAPCPR